MSKTERAWCAGFFDGEGSVFVVSTKRHKGGTTGKMYPLLSVYASVSQVRREPLTRFFKAIGFGSMNKRGRPYKPRSKNHNAYHRWATGGRPSVLRLAKFLWPYLSKPKREQFQKCWKELRAKATIRSPKFGDLPK